MFITLTPGHGGRGGSHRGGPLVLSVGHHQQGWHRHRLRPLHGLQGARGQAQGRKEPGGQVRH